MADSVYQTVGLVRLFRNASEQERTNAVGVNSDQASTIAISQATAGMFLLNNVETAEGQSDMSSPEISS